ncbi:Superinfection immunity protein [Paraburkholderia lycopersici]|uniref:Superinfection immunity protein n=2 Tax=Paraburkholderia lycopersici TaxID=416944 RepID=A0A1G6RIE6_9BURK|nr:superinfection immunity protein [Paraburkholderia lycopersici]SDD04429.1 Superinfection immunity protein [Paraburkholderia lycopersici]
MASRSVFEIVVLAAVVVLYFLPALIADKRRRHDLLIIALFNAVLGWTVLGWLLALFWSFQPNPPEDLGGQTKTRSRRIGMLVFSRRLDDRVHAREARAAERERSSR